MSESPLRIVFLSIENACCSQMAEALARIMGGDNVVAWIHTAWRVGFAPRLW